MYLLNLFSLGCCGGKNWGDLPADLWYKVMEFLNLHDQIRFFYVSKMLLSLIQIESNNAMNRLPWIFELDEISESVSFTSKLFDPVHGYPYQILRIQKSHPDHIYSKYGWLFCICLKEKPGPGRECYTIEVFLFCPYTKETIQLPDLRLKELEFVKLRFTFSTSNPRYEECEFFIVYYFLENNFIIYTCKRDANNWRTYCHFTISGVEGEILLIRGFEYLEGKLYVLIRIGNPFPRAGGSWVFVYDGGNNHEFFRVANSAFNFDYQLFSLIPLKRGLLGIVFTDVSLIKKSIDDDGVPYREFARHSGKLLTLNNVGTRKFEEMKLENCALFLGTDTSGYSPFLVEDLTEEELEVLGNKIFYIEEEDGVNFFDFCKGHVGIQTKYFLLQREEEEEDDDDDEEGARKYRKRTWIEPPNRVKF